MESSDDRKTRLKALRKKRDQKASGEPQDDSSEPAEKKQILKFRNYTPRTDNLKEHKLEAIEVPSEILEKQTKEVEEIVAEAGAQEQLNIAPKKANWDLKRNVEKKMEKLNRRTQRSIVEIIRTRIENEASSGDDEGSDADM